MKDIDFHSTPHFLSLDPRDKKIVVFAVNIENYATSQKWLWATLNGFESLNDLIFTV